MVSPRFCRVLPTFRLLTASSARFYVRTWFSYSVTPVNFPDSDVGRGFDPFCNRPIMARVVSALISSKDGVRLFIRSQEKPGNGN